MANVAEAGTVWNCPNYVGELFMIGANQTPFLNMSGGLEGVNAKQSSSFQFPVAQPWSLEAAAQPSITETLSLTAPTPTTYVRGQENNTVQIIQEQVSISYAKQSVRGEISGLSIAGVQPVTNEKDFQIAANMRQIAVDVDYSFLNGVYQAATDAVTAAKTRGIITACTGNNTVAAAGADLSKAMIDSLLKIMADSGAQFIDMVIFVNAFQKQKTTDIYSYAPEDRNVGGVNIKQIETDFAVIGVVYAPNVPAGTLLVADMSVVSPVFLPVPDKGVLFYEELSKTGASEKGQVYGQIGLDYGPKEYHGTITGLATS
jgi:hypothetical protein